MAKTLSLLDWRRRVGALYAEVRASSDPAAAHELWRGVRDDLFAEHPDSPLLPAEKAAFTGLPVAPYDASLRFELELVTDLEPARLEVPTGTDGIAAFDRIGMLEVPGLGSLDAWWLASYGGGLFVPVKDGLAGRGTYGGGRYLIDSVKGADLGGDVRAGRGGIVVVDLNFAYNPSCAYDPAWACPLAPPGNVLAPPVQAGELIAG